MEFIVPAIGSVDAGDNDVEGLPEHGDDAHREIMPVVRRQLSLTATMMATALTQVPKLNGPFRYGCPQGSGPRWKY